jgi:hypothetical protein
MSADQAAHWMVAAAAAAVVQQGRDQMALMVTQVQGTSAERVALHPPAAAMAALVVMLTYMVLQVSLPAVAAVAGDPFQQTAVMVLTARSRSLISGPTTTRWTFQVPSRPSEHSQSQPAT